MAQLVQSYCDKVSSRWKARIVKPIIECAVQIVSGLNLSLSRTQVCSPQCIIERCRKDNSADNTKVKGPSNTKRAASAKAFEEASHNNVRDRVNATAPDIHRSLHRNPPLCSQRRPSIASNRSPRRCVVEADAWTVCNLQNDGGATFCYRATALPSFALKQIQGFLPDTVGRSHRNQRYLHGFLNHVVGKVQKPSCFLQRANAVLLKTSICKRPSERRILLRLEFDCPSSI